MGALGLMRFMFGRIFSQFNVGRLSKCRFGRIVPSQPGFLGIVMFYMYVARSRHVYYEFIYTIAL